MTWLLCPRGRSLDDGDVARLLTRTLDLLRQARQGRQVWVCCALAGRSSPGSSWRRAVPAPCKGCAGGRVLCRPTVEPRLPAAWLWARPFSYSYLQETTRLAAAKSATRRAPALLPFAAPQVAFCEPLLPPLRRAARQAAAAMDRKPISDLVA